MKGASRSRTGRRPNLSQVRHKKHPGGQTIIATISIPCQWDFLWGQQASPFYAPFSSGAEWRRLYVAPIWSVTAAYWRHEPARHQACRYNTYGSHERNCWQSRVNARDEMGDRLVGNRYSFANLGSIYYMVHSVKRHYVLCTVCGRKGRPSQVKITVQKREEQKGAMPPIPLRWDVRPNLQGVTQCLQLTAIRSLLDKKRFSWLGALTAA